MAFIESDTVTLKDEHIASSRHSFSNDQYMRQKNIEIEGIPNEIDGKNVESTVSEILRQINVHLFEFEDYPRLPLNKREKDKGVIQTTIVHRSGCRVVSAGGREARRPRQRPRKSAGGLEGAVSPPWGGGPEFWILGILDA